MLDPEDLKTARMLREHVGCGLHQAREAIERFKDHPGRYDDVLHALCTLMANAYAVKVKGDREVWNISCGRRDAEILREAIPAIAESFPNVRRPAGP